MLNNNCFDAVLQSTSIQLHRAIFPDDENQDRFYLSSKALYGGSLVRLFSKALYKGVRLTYMFKMSVLFMSFRLCMVMYGPQNRTEIHQTKNTG